MRTDFPHSKNLMLEGKIVEGRDLNNFVNKGRVMLIYDDAVSSGTNEYIAVTYLLAIKKDGDTFIMRPRDVTKVSDEF